MPVSTLGTASVLIVFILTLATATLAILGAHRQSERLVEGAVHGIHAIFGTVAFASMLLVYAFLAGDYSIQYVRANGHPAMPMFYKITAFWGSLDGSILFWILLLSLFASMAIRANRERHRDLIPHAVAILALIMAFFAGLLVFHNNPFAPLLLDYNFKPTGRGMNPLLQNPYMIFHPPSLYLGLVSIAVPYAFGMAAMITGQVDSAWQRSVRRWVLFSWMFLSVGLVLGGLWAYEELGWGGYWAWDPVENAGLFPWLTCTAFLHSVMVQERRGMLKVWNLVLIISTFFLTIFGTFLTRSGVVQSVHAFGEDPALAWSFGGFMVLILVVSFGLLVWRLPLLRARNGLESILSREFAFLVNNWLFMISALFVAGATIYPTLRQWTGDLMTMYSGFASFMGLFGVIEPPGRVSVGAPMFNHYMVPIGLALLFLTGVGPLIAWRKTSGDALAKQFVGPTIAGALAIGIAAWVLPVRTVSNLLCFGLCGFTFWTIVQEFYRGIRVRKKNRPQSVLEALIGLVVKARRRYGGYIVHLGVVLMFLGFAGNSYKIERKKMIQPGEVVDLSPSPYSIRHDGIVASEDWQKDMLTVEFTVFLNGEEVSKLRPARWWYYQQPNMSTSEASRVMTLAGDVYASIDEEIDMTTGLTRVNIYYNPLVNWVWIGFAVMLIGGAICIGTHRDSGN